MKDGILVAIQCKRYAQPIGNKSVQEAYTGATHYRADRAVVIGTGGYTRAAIELADNTGVVLIDAENIAAFTALVTQP
jgi:restriction system protein